MKLLVYIVVFVIISQGLTACMLMPNSDDIVKCSDPRPEICTRQYEPVCGKGKDGTWQVYSTDCTACSHKEVTGYRQGLCD